MTLEQVLDGGYVVAADDWLNMLVVWNGSGRFNVWAHVEGDAYRSVDTFYLLAANAFDAKQIARKWLANVYVEMEEYHNQEVA